MITAVFRMKKASLGMGLQALAMLVWPALAAAQTRDYNPIRRTSATEELPSEPPATSVVQPAAPQTQTWTPPVKGPPGQWRSMRQPGPMQLPASQYIPSRPGVPAAAPGQGAVMPEEISPGGPSGEWQDGSPWQDGPSCSGPNCDGCGQGCGGECGGGCCEGGSCRGFGLCGGACGGGCGINLPCIIPQSWQIFGGVHGFKGPPDRGNNGNFGFQEGFNLGGILAPGCGLGYQFGGQFVQSNLQGDTAVVNRTTGRDQSFFTAGLFKRSCGCGLQGGVVWDMLYDDYYVDMTLGQIRGELSFVGPCQREFGFMFAVDVETDTATLFGQQEVWEPTDWYAFFYRKQFGCGGQCRVWAGFSGESDALIGGEFNIPVSNCWAVATNFNYLIPDENGLQAVSEEAWGLGINLVWYPGGGAQSISACRPLFNVADNATFLVDRHQRLAQ